MEVFCVRLKDSHRITDETIRQKIEKLELETPEKRFPVVNPPESAFESYFDGTFEECQQFIKTINNEIRDLFECCKCKPNKH